VLLSNSELRWLLGDINVSKSFEYKIKSRIRKKIETLTELELLLLVKIISLSLMIIIMIKWMIATALKGIWSRVSISDIIELRFAY
jgi:hypothetical protein